MDISLKKLTTEDMALLQAVGRATYEPYYPHIWYEGGMEWYVDFCFNAEKLEEELISPNIEYWLAADNTGETIGFLKLVLQKPVPNGSGPNALYLEKVYLMPDFFGNGYGQYLIEFAVERARQLKRQAVWLMVMECGPMQVYEKQGFQLLYSEQLDVALFHRMRPEYREIRTMARSV